LKDQLQTIRDITGTAPGEPVQAGVGFLGWILDNSEASDDPRLPVVLAEKPVALFFAFGPDLGKYVAQVRAFDATRDHKTKIFTIVNSVEEARRATYEWKVDSLVVQGKREAQMSEHR
jgi:nitronate monooxygenase